MKNSTRPNPCVSFLPFIKYMVNKVLFVAILSLVFSVGCRHDTCTIGCNTYYTIAFVGYHVHDLDSIEVITYEPDGTFSKVIQSLIYCPQFSDTTGDTLRSSIYNGPGFTFQNPNDIMITVLSRNQIFRFTNITKDGNLTEGVSCNGPDSLTGSCRNPAHLTSYIVNGAYVSTPSSDSGIYYIYVTQ